MLQGKMKRNTYGSYDAILRDKWYTQEGQELRFQSWDPEHKNTC